MAAATAGFKINQGGGMSVVAQGLVTLNFANTVAGATSAGLAVDTITGAVLLPSDKILVQEAGTPTAGQLFSGAYLSATSFTAYFHNITAGAVDPASAVYQFQVLRFNVNTV